jgi:hypothetical protein
MRLSPRSIFTLGLAWAVIFIPFAHSAGMSLALADSSPGATHHHAVAHDDASHHDCHHDSESADQIVPASCDPCSMCQSHPVCHMVVLPEPYLELPAPDVGNYATGLFPAAVVWTFKPAEAPPRA